MERGLILASRNLRSRQRNKLTLEEARQPSIPNVNLTEIYQKSRNYINCFSKDNLEKLLVLLSNDNQVKSLLFCYLFQINEWFSSARGD